MINKFYYFEIKNRFFLLLLIWLLSFIVVYFYKETLMFLLKPNHLWHCEKKFKFYFIFTDVREILSAYITIILFLINQYCSVLTICQIFVFFSAGFYHSEYLFLKRWICLSLIFWIGSIFIFDKILLPVSFNFFLNFQDLTNTESVQMYFESKLIEYLNYYIVFYFICVIYGQVLLFLIFFLEHTILDQKTIKRFIL